MVVIRGTELQGVEERYRSAKQRLLLLDYDGTLAPIVEHPEDAAPDETLLAILKRLSDDVRNTLVVISGRPHEVLEAWLGHLPIEFVAEHSVMRREKDGTWQMLVVPDKAQIAAAASLLEEFAAEYSGTMIEKKRVGITLHYRHAPTLDDAKVRRWITHHKPELNRLGLEEIHGKKILELVPHGVDKGTAARHWLERGDWDFILAAGDDTTDETMFRVLAADDISLHVGDNSQTVARFMMPVQTDFIALLERLSR